MLLSYRIYYKSYEIKYMSVLSRSEDDVKVHDVDKKCTHPWSWVWMEKSIVANVNEILPNRRWDGGPLTLNLKDHIRKV